jgi:hypothetical protein
VRSSRMGPPGRRRAATRPPRAGPLAPFRAPPALPAIRARLLHEGPNARPLFRGDGVALGWGDGTVSTAHGDLSDFRCAQDSEGMVAEWSKADECQGSLSMVVIFSYHTPAGNIAQVIDYKYI